MQSFITYIPKRVLRYDCQFVAFKCKWYCSSSCNCAARVCKYHILAFLHLLSLIFYRKKIQKNVSNFWVTMATVVCFYKVPVIHRCYMSDWRHRIMSSAHSIKLMSSISSYRKGLLVIHYNEHVLYISIYLILSWMYLVKTCNKLQGVLLEYNSSTANVSMKYI